MTRPELNKLAEMLEDVKKCLFSVAGSDGVYNFSIIAPSSEEKDKGYVFNLTNVNDLGELNFLMDQAMEAYIKAEAERRNKFGGLTDKEFMLN